MFRYGLLLVDSEVSNGMIIKNRSAAIRTRKVTKFRPSIHKPVSSTSHMQMDTFIEQSLRVLVVGALAAETCRHHLPFWHKTTRAKYL